ncbi:hypothetical protein AAEY33_22015 [Peribacillus simplex]
MSINNLLKHQLTYVLTLRGAWISIQKRLNGLSKPYGGQTDGWGVMID